MSRFRRRHRTHCRQDPRPRRLRGPALVRRPRTIRTCVKAPRRSRRPGPRNSPAASPTPAAPGPGPHGAGGPPPGRNYARGPAPERDWGGHVYRGNRAWDGGRWRHEVRNGRSGWWWDVGGVWYYYPQRMAGPPAYISEDYIDDMPVAYAPAPPPVAYEPPPPPPPADPGASALGGAIVGGVLGGLISGNASGAAAGAVIGGATGAIAGATAASRPGYYLAQGNCYYRYPSGQYVQADPRACY
ncbi:hypothetical protein QIH95_23485 [Bradyrhizobium japonicum]|nr:hypothetical protein [Bradyrhizobium japonicum]WLB15037.1 hypothetical protein QIH95_23485 [Bradyrhizobium japonicum]